MIFVPPMSTPTNTAIEIPLDLPLFFPGEDQCYQPSKNFRFQSQDPGQDLEVALVVTVEEHNMICQCLIQVAVLTENGISANAVVKDMLAHIEPTLLSCVADEAYDWRKVYNRLNTHPPDVEILIPPCRNAHL
jgi:hypothetical protein